mmetsp:Transcript_78933/g.210851  ORF Transcript_78933/g.210851 Transcript_78933/m.210851 type:complete len:287 (+) Transcript_78933:646-1506(+)
MGPSMQIRKGWLGALLATPGPTLGASLPASSTNLVVKSPTASIMNDTVSSLPELMVKSCHSWEISGTHSRAYIPAWHRSQAQPPGLRSSSRIRDPRALPPGPSRTSTPTTSALDSRRIQRRSTSTQYGTMKTRKGVTRGMPSPSQLLDPWMMRSRGQLATITWCTARNLEKQDLRSRGVDMTAPTPSSAINAHPVRNGMDKCTIHTLGAACSGHAGNARKGISTPSFAHPNREFSSSRVALLARGAVVIQWQIVCRTENTTMTEPVNMWISFRESRSSTSAGQRST